MPNDPAIRAVAALDDELRRGMHAFIRAARRPVTRDEAAAAVGISRKLAAFHLDKLVDAGVLRAASPPPGATRRVGRAPKVYEPTGADITVSIPPRRHDLLADILVDAVLTTDNSREDGGKGGGVREAAVAVARQRGRQVGAAQRALARPGRLGAERALTLAAGLLEGHGFGPARESPTRLRLRDCPFHPLAAKAPELVCGLNHAFLTGLLEGLEATSVTAELAPRAGECCVELVARTG